MIARPLILCLLSCLLFTGCTKNFDDINTDPGAKEDVDAVYLLSTAITRTAYAYQEESIYKHPASAARYVTMVRNETMDKFAWGPRDWTPNYTRLMTIRLMAGQAEQHHQPQYVVLARILRAFNYAWLTDLWGDVPYSQALEARYNDNIHPAFDKQENIYPDIMKELKACNEALMGTLPVIDAEYDVLFNGDVMKWRRFANTLRLRMLLRCSKNYPPAWSDMQSMLNDPVRYPLIDAPEYNASVKYLGTSIENSWPGSDQAFGYDEFDKRKPAKELVDMLLACKDPRLAVWIDKVEDKTSATVDKNDYVGVPNAISQPAQYNGGNNCMSRFAPAMNRAADDQFKAMLIGSWEMYFILAEGLQAGKIAVPGLTAESCYYEGIRQSMNYYNVTAPTVTYNGQSLVKYDGTLRQLIHQKWLAQLFVGAEGWMDQRRTGYPSFTPGPLAAQRSIPLRYMYPLSEILNNSVEYNKATTQMGGDEQTTRMWLIK